MNDQSGVKPSMGKKTKQAGISAGCSQGADHDEQLQAKVVAAVLKAVKENGMESEDSIIDDIGQCQRKNKRTRSNSSDASSSNLDSDSSDNDSNAGTCINHLVFMVTSWKY